MILTVLITSTKHFVVSISYHPKILQLKRLTWSMPMFSGIWTLLYQEEITFPQGQYFFLLLIRILDFLSHGASLLASEKHMARDILKKSKILVMDEVRRLIIIVSSHTCRRF